MTKYRIVKTKRANGLTDFSVERLREPRCGMDIAEWVNALPVGLRGPFDTIERCQLEIDSLIGGEIDKIEYIEYP